MLVTEPSKGPPDSRAGDLAGPDTPGAQPLSTPAMIGVAGVTAAIVISAGVFVAERGEPGRREEPAAMAPPPPVAALSAAPKADHGAIETAAPPLPSAQLALPSAQLALPSAQLALPSALPALPSATPSVTITASAAAPSAPSPSAAATPPPPLPAASLPPKVGYLTAHGTGEGRVYVNGVDVGPLNEANKTPCGLRFVRIGTAKIGDQPPSWLGPGQSVKIACRSITEISIIASP